MEVCRLRNVASMARNYSGGIVCSKITRSILSCAPMMITVFHRGAHTQKLTENMQYISNEKVKLKLDPSTLKLNQSIEKPVCIMMNYMLAKPKHMLKYADLYLTRGVDVVAVSCTPWQLMWPVKGSQVVADELLKFLEQNTLDSSHPVMVHGFSVGAYLWSELLVHTTKDKKSYQPVLDRIASQVWDSGADIHEIPVGFPSAVFPRNKFLQETFRAYIKAHMKIFYSVATKHYMVATGVFHINPCRAPSLFLVSKTDPIGAEQRSREKAASWENLGIKCNVKCWDQSPHVQHYLHHPEEYRSVLYSHLNTCGVLKNKS